MEKEQNSYIVITGASSGIGYAAAKAFAQRNKNLIIIARRQTNLNHLKQEILHTNPLLDVIIKTADLSIIKNVYQTYSALKGYHIEAWINNAGFGDYNMVGEQNLDKIKKMLRLNIEALTIFSSLYVHDYKDIPQSQLINISSAGGYTIVPKAVTYCASKFYVSAFTEGLARELLQSNAKLQVKVLAPAAASTEFGKTANNTEFYDYDKNFHTYHTPQQIAEFLLTLYDSNEIVGAVNRDTFTFSLQTPFFPYAGNSIHNQTCAK